MRKSVMICALLLMASFVTPIMAAYTVEIGTPASEALYPMADWSNMIHPTSIGGGWGGIATDPASNDNLCRTVWGINDARIATITFPTPINSVDIRHLDGLALDPSGGGGDDFEVYVDYVYWGKYVSNPATGEYWVETTFSGTAGNVLMLMATDPAWSGFGTWGQLAIDRVEAIPEPATICLLGIGGLALLKKRRS